MRVVFKKKKPFLKSEGKKKMGSGAEGWGERRSDGGQRRSRLSIPPAP